MLSWLIIQSILYLWEQNNPKSCTTLIECKIQCAPWEIITHIYKNNERHNESNIHKNRSQLNINKSLNTLSISNYLTNNSLRR